MILAVSIDHVFVERLVGADHPRLDRLDVAASRTSWRGQLSILPSSGLNVGSEAVAGVPTWPRMSERPGPACAPAPSSLERSEELDDLSLQSRLDALLHRASAAMVDGVGHFDGEELFRDESGRQPDRESASIPMAMRVGQPEGTATGSRSR